MTVNKNKMTPGPPVLIQKENPMKITAKHALVLGLICNMLILQIVIWSFYDSTKHLSNLEDSSPGLPLKTDLVLFASVVLNFLFTIMAIVYINENKIPPSVREQEPTLQSSVPAPYVFIAMSGGIPELMLVTNSREECRIAWMEELSHIETNCEYFDCDKNEAFERGFFLNGDLEYRIM